MADTKFYEGTLKTIPTDGSRKGSAIVYVYGAADQDPILDEMFTRRTDLKLRWAHGSSVDDIIGKITQVRFLKDQVEVDFILFDTPAATKVYEAMLTGAVTEFSVGFAFSEDDVYQGEDGRWHVRKAELVEVSAVAAGANRETMLTSIKNQVNASVASGGSGTYSITVHNPTPEGKAGRTLSAKTEAVLRSGLEAIQASVRDMEGALAALTGSQSPQTASYAAAVKEWLDAEVGVWLEAEKAQVESRDWQQVNRELELLAGEFAA